MTNRITDEFRILSPTGVLGSGFVETSFERALARSPHFIGCDAGSTDPGPSHLGAGHAAFPRDAVKRDLRLMLHRRAPARHSAADRIGRHRGRRRPPRMDVRHPQGNRRARKAVVQARADPCRAGQGLSQAAAARRPHQAARPGAAIRRRGDRPQRAHRRHDGRRAFPARAGGRRRRGARRALQRHRDFRRTADAGAASRRALPGTRRRSSSAARRRWSTARRPTACSR